MSKLDSLREEIERSRQNVYDILNAKNQNYNDCEVVAASNNLIN